METVDIGDTNSPFDKRAAADLEAMLADAEAAGCKLYFSVGLPERGAADGAVQAQDKFLHGGGTSAGEEVENRLPCGWRAPAPRSITRPYRRYRFGGLVFEAQRSDGGFLKNTPEFEWLYAHSRTTASSCATPGERNVSGVTYEPWHYR